MLFNNILKFLVPTVFTSWFTPSIGSAIGAVAGAVGDVVGGITLGNVASAVGIANGVANLLGGGGNAPSGAAAVGSNASGSGGSSTISSPTFDSNLTPGLTSGLTSPVNLPGRVTMQAPSFNTTQEADKIQFAADGGMITDHYSPTGLGNIMNFHPSDISYSAMSHGGEAHNPEFYSEGGLKHTYVKGDGDGTSDSVPAMLANGEFVIPADVVSSLGNGSSDSGSKVLDEFLQVIRQHKANHEPHKLPPDSKGALTYLSIATKKAKA
jgi:hypothetical protein